MTLIFDKTVFTRYEKTAETDLYELYYCYEPRKQIPVGSFIKPKWIETNKLLLLKLFDSKEDTDVREYFSILGYEKKEEGRQYLKDKFEKFYATRD